MTDYVRVALQSLARYLNEDPHRQMTLAQVTRYFGWKDEDHAYRAMRYALRLTQDCPLLMDVTDTRAANQQVERSGESGSFLHTTFYIDKGGKTMDESTIQATETTQQPEHAAPAAENPAAEAPAETAETAADKTAAHETASAADAAKAPETAEAHDQKPEAPDPAQALAALTGQAAEAELRAAAALAGVPSEKLPYALRMCDRAALCIQGADMAALAKEQIAAVLRDVPELAGRGGSLPGSLGDHKRVSADQSAEDKARAAFAQHLM